MTTSIRSCPQRIPAAGWSKAWKIEKDGELAYDDFDQVVEAGGSGAAVVRSALALVEANLDRGVEIGKLEPAARNAALEQLNVSYSAQSDLNIRLQQVVWRLGNGRPDDADEQDAVDDVQRKAEFGHQPQEPLEPQPVAATHCLFP